jgi:hypothetical protein
MTELAKADRPSTTRAEYDAAAPDIALVRDLLAGTRQMHRRHAVYIAKWPSEEPKSYARRAQGAKVYGGLGRTLSAAVGMLFAKAPAPSDSTPADILKHEESIDGRGTHLKVFAKRRAEDAIADGFAVTLVDFPAVPDGVVVTAANEATLNLRPLWVAYARADVLSWRTRVLDGVETLTQVVLREEQTDDVGAFGVAARVLYRVCRLLVTPDGAREAGWQLLEEVDQDGQTIVVQRDAGTFRDRAGMAFREIPIAVSYAGRTDAIFTAHPPLLDVAWANLEHWRVATNLRYYEDLCCFPQPTIEGELATDALTGLPLPFKSGPGVIVQVTKGSSFQWTEVSGSSLDQLRQSLADKKDEISELGVSFLAKKTRGVETAEAKRLDAAAENSTLATSAQGIEDGLNEALRFHALYLGLPAEQAPTVAINRDFEQAAMDAATMAVYVQAVANAGLPPRLLLEAWQIGGRISPDADLDALEAEIMANQTAIADQQAMEAAQNAQNIQNSRSAAGARTRTVSVERDAQGRAARLVTSGG